MAEQKQSLSEQDEALAVHALAAQQLQREESKRLRHRQKLDGMAKAKRDAESGKVLLDDGRLVEPYAAFMQGSGTDFSVIPDELIKRTAPNGKWHVRWVRKVDNFGEKSETEIGYYQRFGFETIKKANSEEFYERKELIAMQGPPEGFAALLAKSARPGSSLYDQAHGELEDIVRSTNKKAGRRIVDVVTSDEHGPEDPRSVSFR